MPNDTAAEKAGSAENRDNTIARGCHGSRASLTIGRALRPVEHPIDLACHDKIVLVQSLDFLGAQRDGRVTPAEADIRVMAFGFSQVTHVLNKAKRFLKIAKAKASFDTMAVIAQVPIRSLRLKTLRFLMCERRNAAATRGAFLLSKSLGHVHVLPCSLGPKVTALHGSVAGPDSSI